MIGLKFARERQNGICATQKVSGGRRFVESFCEAEAIPLGGGS